ncbi:MAG: hypothetical protein WBM40_00380 [Thiohalocapsa sp.]|jgi:hypothetical protein
MSNYRRYRVSGGTYSLPINLLERRSGLVRNCASSSCQPHLMCADR